MTFVAILATEGPSKEARLGFPIWQRKGGEEKVGQAKKSKLPLEVWWGVSHDFHWQLHGFISCSGFYDRALPPLHSDEGLFCKEKRDHGGELKETGCHSVLLLSTGPNSKDQGQAGCHDSASVSLLGTIGDAGRLGCPVTFCCQERATQSRWCLVQLMSLRPAMPQGHCTCHRAERCVCPAIPLHFGQFGVGISLSFGTLLNVTLLPAWCWDIGGLRGWKGAGFH